MAIYFIADTHFDDTDIINYEHRPFSNVNEMNETLIENWNKTVSPNDEVYHIGDAFHEQKTASLVTQERLINLTKRLNGTKYLIKGNHDTRPIKFYHEAGFTRVYEHPILIHDFFWLSHRPLYMNANTPYANIFGHVHSNPSYQTVSERSHCVCVERIRYAPISEEQVIADMKASAPIFRKEQFIKDQIEIGANETVITFIADILFHQGPANAETIRYLFRSGYCWYFAHILKNAFQGGEVCWAAPFGHFVWEDADGTCYDIEGIYQGEAEEFIPERYLDKAVYDFMHVPGLEYNATKEQIQQIIDKYKSIT